jgi:hypothetical protein
MRGAAREALERWQDMSRRLLSRIEVLALFPILVLGAQADRADRPSCWPPPWSFRHSWCCRIRRGRARSVHVAPPHSRPRRPDTVPPCSTASRMQGMETACFVLEIDDWSGSNGARPETARDVLDECDRRLRAVAARRRSGRRPRRGDVRCRPASHRCGASGHPGRHRRSAARGSCRTDPDRSGHDAQADGLGRARGAGMHGRGGRRNGPGRCLERAARRRAAGPGSVRAHVPGRHGPSPGKRHRP